LEPEPLEKKYQELEPLGEKNQEPETEPEPLEKKSGAGAGAARKFDGSPALSREGLTWEASREKF